MSWRGDGQHEGGAAHPPSGAALRELPRQAARVRDAVAPPWLVDIVRPRRAAPPRALMVRAVLAVCVPLAVGLATHKLSLGLLPAIGGLITVTVDVGGSYLARARRVGSATVFGGAIGLTIGTLIHGRGWIAVVVLVLVAGVSVLLSDVGSVGSVTGLQLLVYSAFGFGPLGALRPWWLGPLEFLVGVAWAMILILPGWLLHRHEAERQAVADVYRAQAARLRAIGTGDYPVRRQAVTAAVNTAYDQLLSTRSVIGGTDPGLVRLMARLNHSQRVSEASAALSLEGNRPPGEVIEAVEHVADSIQDGTPPPASPARFTVPTPWTDTPGARALIEALDGAVRLLSEKWLPAGQQSRPRRSRRERLASLLDRIRGGRLVRVYAIRLMSSIAVAAVVSEILPLQRSYWVVLTVAIVLKPDFGSVFARALQRGLGTVVGAVFGAVILAVVPYGPWLLLPMAVLAALLPYARLLNYGLFTTFLTPLVVVLIDLLDRSGWRLAGARLIDTLLGCAIALVVGYALWPRSWHSHLPAQFAETVSHVAGYTGQSLAGHSPDRAKLRRQTYRELSDLRTEFQRAMSEPRAVSRQTSAWWPALAALEQVMEPVTATAVAIDQGAPPPSPAGVRRVVAVLGQIAGAVRTGRGLPSDPDLPDEPALAAVTDAVRGVLAVVS